ncbi:tetratricopeptide repeat protein [bacterium]|nr:tetratricopeptide repeat protein [bacterium]
MKNIFVIGAVLVVLVSILVIALKPKSIKKEELSVREVEVVDVKEKEQRKLQELYESALTYVQAGELEEAKKVWMNILTNYPECSYIPRVNLELGKYYVSKKKNDIALKYFNKILADFPKDECAGLALYEMARLDEIDNDYQGAIEKYKRIKEEFFFLDVIEDVGNRMNDLTMKLIFSPSKTDFSLSYKVKPGDTLYDIAKAFNNTVDFITEANRIDRNVIRAGDLLKLLDPKVVFTVFIDKSQKILALKMNNEIVKKYKIAVGRNDKTPEGDFKIQNKLKDPVWFNKGEAISPGDPKNILGSRWIGFSEDIGIHGTTDKTDINQQETSGCIRMYNSEIEELYKLLRVGDKVVIEA